MHILVMDFQMLLSFYKNMYLYNYEDGSHQVWLHCTNWK